MLRLNTKLFAHLFAQLRQAQARRFLYFEVKVRYGQAQLGAVLAQLRAAGLVAHFEHLGRGVWCDRTRVGHAGSRFRVFLKYSRGGVGLGLNWITPVSARYSNRCTLSTLRRVARYTAGSRVYVMTGVGLRTLEDCLIYKVGGVLLFTVSLR